MNKINNPVSSLLTKEQMPLVEIDESLIQEILAEYKPEDSPAKVIMGKQRDAYIVAANEAIQQERRGIADWLEKWYVNLEWVSSLKTLHQLTIKDQNSFKAKITELQGGK